MWKSKNFYSILFYSILFYFILFVSPLLIGDFAWGQDSCSVSIDSVWFSEETDCNDSNIVQICYILSSTCPDSLFNVSVRMRPDASSGWMSAGEGWFSTLTDTAGDLGAEVDTGLHCFNWIMKEDTTAEGRGWEVEITARNHIGCSGEVIWNLVDSLTFSSGTGQDITVTDHSIVVAVDGIVPGNRDICLYEYDRCTGSLIRCDTIETDAYNTSQGLTYAFGYLWVAGHDGAIFKLNPFTWEILHKYFVSGYVYFEGLTHDDSLIYAVEGGMREICGFYPDSFVSPDTFAVIVSIPVSEVFDCEGITYVNGQFLVAAPGTLYVFNYDGSLDTTYSTPLPPSLHGASFDGCYLFLSSHSYASHVVYIYGNTEYSEMWLCPPVDTSSSPLDSRPPSVYLSCPGDSAVYAGDTVHLEWSVVDTFWNDDPCSLHIYGIGCSYDTTIIIPNTFYDWVVPSAATGCDAVWFVVSACDSFCNWGSDSCAIPPVCRPIEAEIVCAPCMGFTGCFDQIVQWSLTDLNSINIDTSRTYFSVYINHADGTADTVHLTGDSDSLSFECVPSPPECYQVNVTLSGFEFENSDTVWVTIDSLYDEAGCLTIPEE